MDKRTDIQAQDGPVEKSGGCCGGKSAAPAPAPATPQDKPRVDAKPAQSGCCCARN